MEYIASILSALALVFALLAWRAAKKDKTDREAHRRLAEIGASVNSLSGALLSAQGEGARTQQQQLEEMRRQLGELSHTNAASLSRVMETNATQLSRMMDSNTVQMDSLRASVERKLSALQTDNAQQLESMRRTVDERLQKTLEARLGESFKQVSDRLEQVYRGLGEMQQLASGVGDLKRILTNVKTRGNWGEIQLGQLLEQVFSPEQYIVSAQVKPNSAERVDFAVRLPGRGDEQEVLLPIDAKFPQEDYLRLVEASETMDAAAVEQASVRFESAIRKQAKSIGEKYILPPRTTDFAILFLPSEALFAEALRRIGLQDSLQREYRILLAGPTTLLALTNSLQMGFRTLAIEKRAAEVWKVLGAVKSEFGKFGDALDKTQKKLQEAVNTIDSAQVRTRAIERRLRTVETLPEPQQEDIEQLEDAQ